MTYIEATALLKEHDTSITKFCKCIGESRQNIWSHGKDKPLKARYVLAIRMFILDKKNVGALLNPTE